ncbi:hypothetical protein QAD02_003381 [Eretmocerus hayati]|uniref:Uncharacterized protein n=1 Tax=Eretmocerus hayati TaxID=131215 RepID=A0ACC2NLY6_9HYME|nr:hypothetical protein QAD02_003381 [Eretmocerus hayati]
MINHLSVPACINDIVMEDHVQHLKTSFKNTIAVTRENVRVSVSFHNAAKLDVLTKAKEFDKAVKLYKVFLNTYELDEDSSIDLSPPIYSTGTQTEKLLCTREVDAATQTINEVRDVGI